MRVRLHAQPPGGLPGQVAVHGRLVRAGWGFGGRALGALRNRLVEVLHTRLKPAVAATERLRHGPVQLAGQEEARNRQQQERSPPGDQARHATADYEARGSAGDLAAEDVRVYASTLA